MVRRTTSHLVADSESEKVIKARQWNESAGASSTMHLHIVRKQWLEDSVSAGAALDEAQYSFDGAPVVPKLDASGEKNFGVDARPTKFKASTPTKHLPLAVPPQDPLPDRSMIPFDQSTLERNHHRPPNFTLISQVNGSGFMRSSVKPKPPTELADLASTASTELAPPLRKQRLEESVCVDHVLAVAPYPLDGAINSVLSTSSIEHRHGFTSPRCQFPKQMAFNEAVANAM
jgi:hypothetical protein